jgi:hypothetical protein
VSFNAVIEIQEVLPRQLPEAPPRKAPEKDFDFDTFGATAAKLDGRLKASTNRYLFKLNKVEVDDRAKQSKLEQAQSNSPSKLSRRSSVSKQSADDSPRAGKFVQSNSIRRVERRLTVFNAEEPRREVLMHRRTRSQQIIHSSVLAKPRSLSPLAKVPRRIRQQRLNTDTQRKPAKSYSRMKRHIQAVYQSLLRKA